MTPERARELLGGLAAGVLTPEERQTLFEAALHDQLLFNEVADELEFAAFLQSPETRAQLANRIEVEPARRRWWALRPAWLTLTGVLAASIVLFVAIRPRPGQVAQLSVTEAPKAALPAPPPAELAKKESAQFSAKTPASLAARQKAATMSKSTPSVNSLPLAPPAPSKDSVAENRPELRDRRAPAQAAPAPSPMMEAAPPPPVRAPSTGQPAMARAFTESAAAASLTGTVRDPSGMAVPGARLDIVNTATNATIHAATDAQGRFVALSLPPGPYTVATNAPGFIAERRSVTIEGNQPAQLDIPLRVGAMTDSVEVSAAAPQVPLSQNQTQVAVLDFANGSQPNQSGAQIADQLSSQLLSTGQFRVIDREKVQQAAQNQTVTGRPPNAQEAAALGRSIGADAVIVGAVQAPGTASGGTLGAFAPVKAAPNVSVMAEIIDTKQGRPVKKVSADAASLRGATNILGSKIQSQLTTPAEGNVTRLTGDIVAVAFADPPGLRAGDHCDVIRGTRKIGELVITSVNGLSAFGKFSGITPPRAGDRVTSSR
jgi:curli biogenesis system outer membrane secretion channel CsgG